MMMMNSTLEDPLAEEGCYCLQGQACQHWIASKMDKRLETAQEHSHKRQATFEQERLEEDHRPIVSELQRELRAAMLEIEKLAEMSRDLAKANQDLEEARLIAVSDQTRTAKRLLLMSGQLEHTEQKLFSLTQEMADNQRDADRLRIERIRREALQEREDAGRLRIDTLQDELQEVQQSERSLHQKLIHLQTRYETLAKRHDNLKRQQQELELARESKEALAWLKETTDRLCSPPPPGFGPSQEQTGPGSAPISIHHPSPSSSPPYPSSFIDPPLAAQNQLISLIKELATTNSTLRSELNEYRDLLQDSRNEVLTLRSQVEDFEHGHAFESCCGARLEDASDSFRTSRSAWSTLDLSTTGIDALSHIGTLGSIPGSPPPLMTTPKASRHHRHARHSHHPLHLSGVRGNVFGELERLYSQGHKSQPSSGTKKRSKNQSKGIRKQSSRRSSEGNYYNVVSPGEHRRKSTPTIHMSRSPPNPTPSKLQEQPFNGQESSPTSSAGKAQRSFQTGADQSHNPSDSGSGAEENNDEDNHQDLTELSLESGSATSDSEQELDIRTSFPEAELLNLRRHSLRRSSNSLHLHPLTLLPPASLEEEGPALNELALMDSFINPQADGAVKRISSSSLAKESIPNESDGPLKNRTSSISLLSAELQKATQSESRADLPVADQGPALEPQMLTSQERPAQPTHLASEKTKEQGDCDKGSAWTTGRNRLPQHEKSSSDQELLRQRRRLSEPLHHLPSSASLASKKNRPGSIYSLRKPHPRVDSPDVHHHLHSASLGGMPELQRCKSAELVEQIMAERRNRMMEAWRVGVVAAAVTQQQSIHSIVAFGDKGRDPDAASIRSKASRRRGKGTLVKDGADANVLSLATAPTIATASLLEHESSTVEKQESVKAVDVTGADATVAMATLTTPADDLTNMSAAQEKSDPAVTPAPLTIDTAGANATLPAEQDTATNGLRRFMGHKTPKALKRKSWHSPVSTRSPHLRSPLVRSPLLARDRKFPSEASTASEAFSNRRHDQHHSPYLLLHTLSTELLERLNRSDTRELNRRLQRTFDIRALSQMSNSVIENVLTDVSNLGERFRWVEAQVDHPMDEMLAALPTREGIKSQGGGSRAGSDREENGAESDSDPESEQDWVFSVAEFFPLAHVVQEMLSEIGKLRMTINELQLSYVQKVEQDLIKAEKDFKQDSDLSSDGNFDSDDGMDQEKKDRVPEKLTQRKSMLALLERPRILGSASTGVSGFFSKVFRGNGPASQDETGAKGATKDAGDPTPVVEVDKDKPAMSKSKSGLVVAETSRIFAESAWLSSPGKAPPPRAPMSSVFTEPSRVSVAAPAQPSSSKLSAATSLAAMTAASPARLDTRRANGTDNTPLASPVRAIDITFSPEAIKASLTRSPGATSVAGSTQGLFSRSIPLSQSFGTLNPNARQESLPSHVPASIKSTSSAPDGSVEPISAAALPDLMVSTKRLSSPLTKPPRSIGLSTRVSGPALNVVTKQDVFQDHGPASSSSSVSVTAPTMATTAGASKRSSASMASTSSNSGASEVVSVLSSRLHGAKPTLITRSALTVGTPSTSTVSSPMSTTSWFDSRRSSGAPTAETSMAGAASWAAGHDIRIQDGATGDSLVSKDSRTVAAATGASEPATRSLGRATGRESALAFLRGDMAASSVLGSLFQSPSQDQPQSSNPPPTSASSSSQGSSIKSMTRKGKGVASSDASVSREGDLEVLNQEYDEDELHNHQRLGLRSATEGALRVPARKGIVSSRSETGMILVIGGATTSNTRTGVTTAASHPPPATTLLSTPTTSLAHRATATSTSTAVAYVVALPDGPDDREGGGPGGRSRPKRAVFDRDLIKASQKRILANVTTHQPLQHQQQHQHHPPASASSLHVSSPHSETTKPFEPISSSSSASIYNPRRARALSIDSIQSQHTEPLKANEIMDLWRAGAGVSRDLWRGFIKKVDGRES